MGLLNRIFGTEPRRDGPPRPTPPESDTYALERYRYMLQTAPPETIEQAHREAFERLTPDQRRHVLEQLARSAPASERPSIERAGADDPSALARLATRAEIRQPGIMERTLGTGSGAGFGAGLLGSFAAGFAGSMVAHSFFSALGGFGDHGEGLASADAAEDPDVAGVGDLDGDIGAAGDFDGMDFDA